MGERLAQHRPQTQMPPPTVGVPLPAIASAATTKDFGARTESYIVLQHLHLQKPVICVEIRARAMFGCKTRE